MSGSGRLVAVALPELPDIVEGDDLGSLLIEAWRSLGEGEPGLAAADGDVLVVTQKVVSKAEGATIDLSDIEPSEQASTFAAEWDKDARQVEVVLREATEIVRMERGVIITRTHHGFVCANAGVDASNIEAEDIVTLLPRDPDRSARELRDRLEAAFGARIGVIVSDSFGRPWRWGITDVALGVAGFAPLDDLRGQLDTAGRPMRATVVAVADEIAGMAELASGKLSRRPAVLVRGASLPAGEGTVVDDVVMALEDDLFR